MKVAFDEQIFLLQQRGGVSRYFVELINAFTADASLDVTPVLPFRRVWNEHAANGLAPHGIQLGPRTLAPYPMLAAAWARPARRSRSLDVMHHTFYNPRYLRDCTGVAKVVTIYDMIPELFPDTVPKGVHMAKREYVRRADLVLAISDSARDDLIGLYGQPDVPVVVTPLAVDDSFRGHGRAVADLPERYVLYVGRRGGYKDFSVLAAAFAAITDADPDLTLFAVGGGPWTNEEIDRARRLGLEGRLIQRALTDDELVWTYAHAAAFVMPSRYEGFGLPALEAMAAGAPAVLANASSLPQVGGDAAVYFQPGDADALSVQLSRLLGDDTLRGECIRRGKARAAGFTWEATAAATARAYQLLS